MENRQNQNDFEILEKSIVSAYVFIVLFIAVFAVFFKSYDTLLTSTLKES